MSFLRSIWVMYWRQLLRFWRLKSRVLGSVITPVIWLVFFGMGWSSLFNSPMASRLFGGLDYITFLAPGILMMSVFTASFVSGVSVILDKERGFMKELLVAPASRAGSIVGRSLGDATIAIVQGLLILALSLPLASGIKLGGIPLAAVSAFLVGLTFSGVGIFLALRIRSMEGFQVILNLIMLPLLFLSGAFFPIDGLPGWMKVLSLVNPMTYGVDLARWSLVGVSSFGPGLDLAVLGAVAALALFIAAFCYERATLE